MTTKTSKVAVPTEHQEQAALVRWFDLQYPKLAPLLYAIPNGANKGFASAAKFKREGLRAGFPDLGLAVARRGYNGMFVEMKRVKGGTVSDAQDKYLRDLGLQGFYTAVAKGFDEACEQIHWYLH